ncbi:hypothetical protein IMSAG049_01331 [Clostridiales bacterium]|nr:hypothetical protein IMSAG049_01331 [Clostridiales bacterium]
MNEFANINTPEGRERIAKKVLESTGRTDMFKPSEATNIRVNYAQLTQNGVQDALVTVNFGPEATIMAVYTPTENGYEFVGEVGYFFNVDNIGFLQPSDGNDVIAFRESNRQSIGSLENSSFIRGYTLKDGSFKNVLNVDENIESWWNDSHMGISDDEQWHKVTQATNIENSNNDTQIDAVKRQTYSTASPTESKTIPEDSQFNEQDRRTVDETFIWDDEWKTYIAGEKIEKATGERVAILKDFNGSPYILTGDTHDRYRILRQDGTVDVLDYEEVIDVPLEEPGNTVG